MTDRDKLLESLGLDVSDGIDLDWDEVSRSLRGEPEEGVLENLQSLSLMARFYQELRRESQQETDAGLEGRPEFSRSASDAEIRQWGHLEVLEQVGRGSYGEVFLARDTRLNREVALKLIRGIDEGKRTLRRLLGEGERLAKVKHPNLVTIHGAEVRDGDLGLWMEYVKGTTLKSIVKQQGPLSAREAALLGMDLLGALAAIHSAGILHRDIKAQNVMREEGGRIVLMDLGSGTEIREEQDPKDGVLSGTPLYMAPELLAGAAADVRSDIYSLGVLLYYAVTGTYPVRADSLGELQRKHALDRRHHLRDVRPDLPAAFVGVIERALDPKRENRFASAGEMERALSAAMGLGESGEVQRPSVRGGSPASPRRFLGILAIGAVAIIAAVVLFLWPGLLTGSSYTVEAALYRAQDGRTEQLLPGARVALGDRLHLQFEASRPVHLYVLAEDDRGEAFLLFPLPGRSLSNPLPAKRMHRIPPDEDGGRMSWGVSSAGGTEHILIVASPKALTDFEERLSALPAPVQADAAMALPLDAEALAGLRGIGHLLEEESSGDPEEARAPFEMARRLGGGIEKTGGVWVRQIDLINPGL